MAGRLAAAGRRRVYRPRELRTAARRPRPAARRGPRPSRQGPRGPGRPRARRRLGRQVPLPGPGLPPADRAEGADLGGGSVVREHQGRRRGAGDRPAVGRRRLGRPHRGRGAPGPPPPAPRRGHHGGGVPRGGAARRLPCLPAGRDRQRPGPGALQAARLPLLAPLSLPRGAGLKSRLVATRRAPMSLGEAGVLVTFGNMATSRSRGASGSRGGRTGTGGSDYYNDESPDVILPTPPPGGARGGGARRGSGSARSTSGRGASGAGSAKGGTGSGAGAGRGRATGGGRSGGSASGKAGAGRSSKGNARGGTSARGKSGGRSGQTGRTGQKGRQAKGGAAKKTASQPTSNLLIVLTAWLFRAIAMAWLLVAGLVGGIVRRFGRNARELHPDHKR